MQGRKAARKKGLVVAHQKPEGKEVFHPDSGGPKKMRKNESAWWGLSKMPC